MLAFLPAFERGDFRDAIEFYMQRGSDPPQVYDLASEVGHSGFVFPFDWAHWPEAGAATLPDGIASADILTLRKLMTAFVRADHFSGGSFSENCSNGTIERILRRLERLSAAGEV